VLSGPLRRPADARPGLPLDDARRRLEGARKQRQQGRLASPVGADERDRLAVRELEIGRCEGEPRAEAPRRRPGREQRRMAVHLLAAREGVISVGASGAAVSTSTGTGKGSAPASPHGSSTIRSEKNSQIARPAASSGSATKTPGNPWISPPASKPKMTSSGWSRSAV